MFDNAYIFLSFALSGIMLGWISLGDENQKPLPPLTESTPWRYGADHLLIDRFGVSPDGMWDIVTQNKKHIIFFEGKDGYTLHWDISNTRDVPCVTFKTRLVPPRKVEFEMTLHAKNNQQLFDLRIPEKAMHQYVLRSYDKLEHV